MESTTSNLVKGRKKLRYFTNDEGSVPRIKEVFSVRDIDEFLECASKTKLDSGFLSPLQAKGIPEVEEETLQEAECVDLPTKEKNIGEDGLTDKDSPFKDSAPLKTSSPIVEATSTQEVEGEEKPLGSPLLLADDNEDPIEGNMDKPLSVQVEDLAKEPSVFETLTLTPTKKFTLAVNTQGDKSPILTPLKGRSRMNLTEKNLSSVSVNDIQTEVKMNEEQSSSLSLVVSTQTADAEPVVEAIHEPDSSLKASSTSNDVSFQRKLREFLMPRNIESARMPVPLRPPSPQELDEDFFILEDEAPLLFSLKRKTQSQTSRASKQPSKVEEETGPNAVDGASSGTENEPGSGSTTSMSQQAQAKATAVQKKRGKQAKATEHGDEAGVLGKSKKVEGDPSPPSEAPSKAPDVQKKKGKQGKSTGKGAGAKEAAPGPEGVLAEASSVPPLKASIAPKKRGKQGKQPVSRAEPEEENHDKGAGNTATAASSKARASQKKRGRTAAAVTAAEPQIAEDADANMDSTEFERRPATPKSKVHAPTAPEEGEGDAEINTRDYGHSPAPISSAEVPEQAGETVTKKARKKTLQREKPFLNKKTKKRNFLRRSSDMFSVSSSPELKSAPKTSKAASRTTRPAKASKPANSDAVPSQSSLKTKSKRKEKESKAVEKRKRPRAAPPEEAEEEADEGQGLPQSDSPLRADQLDATGDSEARQQEPSLDLSGSSAMSKRKRNKPGNWWEVKAENGDEDSVAASSPPKRPKVSRKDNGKKPKQTRKQEKEAAASPEQDSASVVEERTRSPAKLPRQQKDGKPAPKSRQRKVKGDGQAGQKRLQTGKGRRRKLEEEATLAPANHAGEEVGAESHRAASELQVNMSSEAPELVQSLQDGEAVSRTDVSRPQGRQRRPPSNWWEGQRQQQPEPEQDIIPSPSPPPPAPEPRVRVPTPGMRGPELRLGRAAKLGSGSRKPLNHLGKNPTTRLAGTPKTLKGSLAAFGAIYTSGKPHGRNAAVQNVRKNLLNSLEDSSNRSNDHTSIDGSSQDRLNCDDVNLEVCDRVSNSVVLDSVVRLKTGHVIPASDWPSQSLGVAGLISGPSSMIESFEDEDEDQTLPSTLRIPMALSEGDICGPLLRPLTLVPDDWQNLTYWLRKVWQTNVKHTGQVITADHFHWFTHEGRALGHKFDLVCNSYANGKLLLGSYMRKPEQVDQHTTTVFNIYTSSVRVQINNLKSDYHPGQAFVVPRGQSYSIRNLTPVPAILWYHRMFLDIMEDS